MKRKPTVRTCVNCARWYQDDVLTMQGECIKVGSITLHTQGCYEWSYFRNRYAVARQIRDVENTLALQSVLTRFPDFLDSVINAEGYPDGRVI